MQRGMGEESLNMGEEAQNARQCAFSDYKIYYRQVWPLGDLSLCREPAVTEKAKRFLLTETDPDSRFTVFDFYRTVSESRAGAEGGRGCRDVFRDRTVSESWTEEGRRDCRDVLKDLAKASEVLETLCVNLFLFPWKKEIKTLKTFTGPFVYWIKPVLPQAMVKCILESIGYRHETDMQYRLDESADPRAAALMGFELFLARQECEYLLGIVGQDGSCECEEVLQQRFSQAPSRPCEASEGVRADVEAEPAPAERENTSLRVSRREAEEEGEEEPDRGGSLVNPGELPPGEDLSFDGTVGGGDEGPEGPRSLEVQPPDTTVGPARSLLSDDGSIREMREHYPDLTFRQKPVFGETPGPGQGREKAVQCWERGTPKGSTTAGGDLYVSVARLPECRPIGGATAGPPEPRRHPPDGQAQEGEPAETETTRLAPGAGPRGAPGAGPRGAPGAGPRGAPGAGPRGALGAGAPENSQASADESLVTELAERMGQMSVREYCADAELKYPVEETAWQEGGGRCRGGSGGRPTPLGSPRDEAPPAPCHPSRVLRCGVPGCCDRSSPPRADGSPRDTIKEPPQSYYIPPPSRGLARQPEEELLKTYVLVESPGATAAPPEGV